MKLYDYQIHALDQMRNGCILYGGVGSGKSITGLAYYYLQNHGDRGMITGSNQNHMQNPMDLYVITTARKRDTKEWEAEMAHFLLSPNPDVNFYENRVVVDSWNNIKKYVNVKNSFFIFDEQRVVGSGSWVKSFLKITDCNQWILLSATPGDTWQDYIPVFIANGFYRNRTEFIREHIVYNPRVKFPQVERYLNKGKLIRLRDKILVKMDYKPPTTHSTSVIDVSYDISLYKEVTRSRWDPYRNEPVTSAAALCYLWRKIVNSDPSRGKEVVTIANAHSKVIVFYCYDYELDILRGLDYGKGFEVAEWNGHKHMSIPKSDKWVYLVQYAAGAEGWNCVETDTLIFYSLHYSYKMMTQAAGRIDRLNTPFEVLHYYYLMSWAPIDVAINRALKSKKNFNEKKYMDGYFGGEK